MNKKNLIPLFAVIGLILINTGTLIFTAPLSQNLSDLGSALGHPWYLRIWAGSAAGYFYWYTSRLMKKIDCYAYKERILLLTVCIGMVVSVLLPYRPYEYPELAKWHTRIAMWSTIGYALIFFYYLFELMKKDFLLYTFGFKRYMSLIIFDCLLYLLNGGVSTLLEISFTIGMGILLPSIYYRNSLKE